MKKVLVLGGGISGCSVAYFLKNKGYDVKIIEKNRIGGLCATDEMGGICYEFGPHICYAVQNTPSYDLFHKLLPEHKEIKYFPKQSMDGKLTSLGTFPITVSNIFNLPAEKQVKAIEELYHVNLDKPDYENFEKYIISRVGETMYEYCYKNYNRKQWGMEPSEMDSEWAKFRNFYLRAGDYGMFGDKWQGHPRSYNNFFKRLTEGIEVIYDTIETLQYDGTRLSKAVGKNDRYTADVFISTLPVDFLCGRKDELEYRGITKIIYLLKGASGLPTYLCTFPNHYSWTRITDYGIQAQQDVENSLISFAISHASTDKNLDIDGWYRETEDFIHREMKREIIDRMHLSQNYVYPVSSGSMLAKYKEIIRDVSSIKNLITFGRLGVYAYISMCTAVDQASNVADNLENVLIMDIEERYNYYKELRGQLS